MRTGMRIIALVIPLAVTSVALACLVWLISAGSAQAASCDVPSGTHPTIQSAVGDPGCNIINLTDALYIENVTITRSLTIRGQGALSTTVDGNASGSVFSIRPRLVVTLTNLTITNGYSLSGGGINNDREGILTLVAVTIVSNTASVNQHNGGGGIYNGWFSMLSVIDSIISHNSVTGICSDRGGGAILSDGPVEVASSTLAGNSSSCQGGAIDMWGSSVNVTLTVSNSALVGNSAIAGGGGIFSGGSGDVQVTNSALIGNSAGAAGGGIFAGGIGTLNVTNSTLSANSAGEWNGGGINTNATVQVINSTFNGNSTDGRGGGIFGTNDMTIINTTFSGNSGDSGGAVWGDTLAHPSDNTLILNNSTVFANTGGGVYLNATTANLSNNIIANNPAGYDCGGNTSLVHSLGHNLNSDNTCNLTAPGDITNTIPLLGPLQDNGGPTLTHALLPESPAIDAGDNATCPSVDQRGVTRPLDGNGDGFARCDIGAYELNLWISKTAPPIAAIGTPITYTLWVTNFTPITLTGVVITDVVPIGATYLSGGTLIGNVVSWTVPSVASNTTITRQSSVSATTAITNSAYRVSSNEGHEARSNVEVVTLVETPVSGLVATNDSPTALGDATALTASVAAGSHVSYSWDFGDGTTGIGEVMSHIYEGVGNYTAIVTASNSVSSIAAATPVTVTDVAIIGLNASSDSPTALGSATTLTATVTAGSNVSYSWEFGDGMTDSGPVVSHVYPAAGIYTAVVTASNSVNTLTSTTTVTVNARIYLPAILMGSAVNFADEFDNPAGG